MRVTFLTQWFDPEPGAIRGLPLARELVKRGVDVEVVTGFPNYPGGRVYDGYRIRPWKCEVMEGVPVVRVALYPSHDNRPVHRVLNYGSFALSSAILGSVLTKRPDVLYVYHPPPTVGFAGAVMRRAHGVPVVYHIADMWPESVVESGMLGAGAARRIAEPMLGAFCKWIYRDSAHVTVLSPGFKRLLMERGVPEEKISVVYNWADDALFKPLPRDEALARELGMAGKFNVVYAGNFGAFQGLETVIRAAALTRDLEDVQYVLVGTGVEEPKLKQLASELALPNVRFVARRPMVDMPRINALADVLLTHLRDLSFFEATIPSKVQVNLASGRPNITAVRGDAAELMARAGAGPVVAPEDPAAMAGAVRELHAMTRAARERLGTQGREYYLQEMSLNVGTGLMKSLFARVAHAGETPAETFTEVRA